MRRLWRYALVAVMAFTIGSATVVSAQSIQQFVISNLDGSRNAEVTEDGRLQVDVAGEVAVNNLPEVQNVRILSSALSEGSQLESKNLGRNPIGCPSQGGTLLCSDSNFDHIGDTALGCFKESGGFSYSPPAGKEFLLTDAVNLANTLTLWTTRHGGFITLNTGEEFSFQTPVVIGEGERLCSTFMSATPFQVFISGQLRDAPQAETEE